MPYLTIKDAQGVTRLVKVKELPEPPPFVFDTGDNKITLEMAQKELLKNTNNYDRIRKTANKWTWQQESYYQKCHDIVERYKKALKGGLMKPTKKGQDRYDY